MNKLITIMLFLFIPSLALATEYTADSCSYADVQSKYANSTAHGDTLNIPAGTCGWGSMLTVTKGVHFAGAGTTSTIITRNGTAIKADVDSPNNFSVSGIRFVGNGNKLCITGSQTEFLVDNNAFHDDGDVGLQIIVGSNTCANNCGQQTLGVISANSFLSTVGGTSGDDKSFIYITSDGTANGYSRSSGIGGADNMVFVEDNTFYAWADWGKDHAVWTQCGGSYVFRYNTVDNTNVDMHGNCSWWGGREFEIYNNDFDCSQAQNEAGSDGTDNAINVRGGTGVIWGNTWVSTGGATCQMRFTIYDMRLTAGCNATLYPGNQCTTADINSDDNYPWEYGLGRGEDNGLDPIYSWGNSWMSNSLTYANLDWVDGSQCDSILDPDMTLIGTGARTLVEEDRDWYFQTARPTYTPYTYPHPLRGEQEPEGVTNVLRGGSLRGGSIR